MRYAFSDGLLPSISGSGLELATPPAVNPGALRMLRYQPEGLPPGAPLLVILHGCGQSAAALDQGAGWSTLAQRYGFALLAPEQTQSNNMGTCFNWFLAGDTGRGQGEAESIYQMVQQTISDFAIDPARVFVTGLSAGGAMTSALLAAYPEIFAAGAIVAGLPVGAAANMHEAMSAMYKPAPRPPREWGDAVRQASDHKGPWPRVSVWHGDADRTVGIANMEAIVAQWRDVHRLTAKPQEALINGALYRGWGDGKGPAKLEAYTIPGMGHGVPIRPGAQADCCGERGPFILDAGISSSFHIAEFFGLIKAAASVKPAAAAPKRAAAVKPAASAEPFVLPQFTLPVKLPTLRVVPPIKQVIVKALTAAGLMKK